MRKYISVDFDLCKPEICNPESGICPASAACTHNLLEQEDIGEAPALLSSRMCVGCAKCIEFCSLKALSVVSGH